VVRAVRDTTKRDCKSSTRRVRVVIILCRTIVPRNIVCSYIISPPSAFCYSLGRLRERVLTAPLSPPKIRPRSVVDYRSS